MSWQSSNKGEKVSSTSPCIGSPGQAGLFHWVRRMRRTAHALQAGTRRRLQIASDTGITRIRVSAHRHVSKLPGTSTGYDVRVAARGCAREGPWRAVSHGGQRPAPLGRDRCGSSVRMAAGGHGCTKSRQPMGTPLALPHRWRAFGLPVVGAQKGLVALGCLDCPPWHLARVGIGNGPPSCRSRVRVPAGGVPASEWPGASAGASTGTVRCTPARGSDARTGTGHGQVLRYPAGVLRCVLRLSRHSTASARFQLRAIFVPPQGLSL